ncbi:MAG: hypothetical protein U5K33_03060 [Halofilum sp. (in: g-proteobacteria)]|nr:hypothetical protein [Halofilum sp. (in: g-proteobacteria)]
MMRRRDRTNLVLLALAAVLGVAVLLLPEPRPERPPPAVDFDPDAVERLRLDRIDREKALIMERRSGSWFVTAPIERRADSGRVARALSTLRMPTSSCYATGERDPATFGLAPPQATLQLDSITVTFGYRAPDGRRYIRAQERLCLVDDVTLPILGGEFAATGDDQG